jgi:glucose-6-phosphate 1-epimerase
MASLVSDSPIEAWNRRFAIFGVRVVADAGGLAKIEIATPQAAAEIYLQGAHLTSWKPAGGGEVVFLSRQSKFEAGKAIRGGIPVCFPWFRGKADDAKAPAHGFARTSEWEIEGITSAGNSVAVELSLTASEATRRWWPHDFEARLRFRVGERLELELAVKNTGDGAFRFEEALHTYHRVGDAARVKVGGLDGVTYLDNRDGNRAKVQMGPVEFTAATDNAYQATAEALEIADAVLGRRMRVEKRGSRSTVVWNPWIEGAAAMADLGDDEWREFACVEAANILEEAVTLGPGESHAMGVTIEVLAG